MKKGILVGLGVLVMVGFGAVTGFCWPVPDTGQTKCYDDFWANITCPLPEEPFFGQDANYTVNPKSYTKLDAQGNDLPISATNWSMVRDNITGLIWEVKTDDGSIHDKDNGYTWYDSNPDTNGGDPGTPGDGTDTEDFINTLNAQVFGGYSDWRMPTVEELVSILDFGNYDPAIDQDFFPNINTDWDTYWPSSFITGSPGLAWGVSFNDSWVSHYMKSSYLSVRAVRGTRYNSSEQFFITNGDGTVTDSRTGLMWQQSSSPDELNWEDGLIYCESLLLAGYNDWRMPTVKELASIVDRRRREPAIDIVAFMDSPDIYSREYWSSSSDAYLKVKAWDVDFDQGYIHKWDKSLSHYVRAVRGGQQQLPDHLTILKPIQSSKWNLDAVMPITWGPAGMPGNVTISLSRHGGQLGSFETLAVSTPNDGDFQWTVTGGGAVNAALRIEPVDDPSKGSVQSLFSIVNNVSIVPLVLSVAEPDGQADFTLKLTKAPVADVSIDLTTTNPGEFTLVDGNGNRANHLTLIFDDTNWTTGIDVTIRAEADATLDGDQKSQVLTSVVRSNDPSYSGLNIANISVTVQDDQSGVSIDSVYPCYGAIGGDLDVSVRGLGFDAGSTLVYVIPTGGSETYIWPVTVDDPETLHITIPDPGVEMVYDLKITNSGVGTDVLPGAITFADSTAAAAQRTKKAIIVAGGGPFIDNDLWLAARRNANHAYAALFGQGYEADSIQYLQPGAEDVTGNGQNDVDADATLATLETAITDWSANTSPAATDLMIYLIGPGRGGEFLLKSTEGYEVSLPASTLDGWLDSVQASLTGNLIVIIDAPQSGSFLAPLAAPGRIVIAGSSANGRAWFLDDGEISFSWPFWDAVYNDGELFAAFDHANDLIGLVQTPSIDTNGDGLPDSRKRRASDDAITLGRGRDVDTDPPSIGKTCPDATLDSGSAYELWAEEVAADNGLSQIWARIFPPVESFQPGDRPVLVLPTLRLQDMDGDGRYAKTYEDFIQSGAYKVLIHATDKRDHQSIPKPVRITQTVGPTFEIGDLNVNGVIDLSDVITALKAAAGLSIHNTLHLEPTGDDRIGVPDALFLLQKISGIRD